MVQGRGWSKRSFIVPLIAVSSSLAFCYSPPEHEEPTNYSLNNELSGDAKDSMAGMESTAERDLVDLQPFITIANVRLRQAPSISSQVILTVPVGASVFSAKQAGKWRFVSYGDHSGWMFADLMFEKTSEVSPISLSKSDRDGGQALIGRATVIDGDTIEIAGTRVRFNGIDAPESIQLCQDAEGRSYRCGQ